MNKLNAHITKLHSIRNRYGKKYAADKIHLLHIICSPKVKTKKALQTYHDTLLFLIAYPDNKTIYTSANQSLRQLQENIKADGKLQFTLYNSGITNTAVCAAYSFEMVKWLRKKHPGQIKFISLEANDGQIQSILSVVMLKTESEILQDANAEWRGWLKRTRKKGEDLLDQLIGIFDSTTIRPEVKDELWNAIGINVEINFPWHCALPMNLINTYYHRSLIRKHVQQQPPVINVTRLKLNEADAEQVIDCSRMILIRHLREIDPISFTSPKLISYYQLPRGISIALMGMVAERRHPVDSYMGYMVFKNGLPVAYAGSWILFNSGRIGLNVFPGYRGGESQYIFQQVLQLHSKVYGLKRFSVDPYQVGKENHDGINSGAFWVYFHAGFRPLLKTQQVLANAEALKIKNTPGYRSPGPILVKLADCRLQLMLNKTAVQFDATDLSIAWAGILTKKYNNNRKLAAMGSVKKLADLLQIKNYHEEKMNFILQNWNLLLLANENELRQTNLLKNNLKKLFELKASGREEDYITELQRATGLRKFLEDLLKGFKL